MGSGEDSTMRNSNAACHQLTLLTGGKNSSLCMKVQGRLMQARFIEIDQVFAKRKVCCFTNSSTSTKVRRDSTWIKIPSTV